jgi:hypothetical protein
MGETAALFDNAIRALRFRQVRNPSVSGADFSPAFSQNCSSSPFERIASLFAGILIPRTRGISRAIGQTFAGELSEVFSSHFIPELIPAGDHSFLTGFQADHDRLSSYAEVLPTQHARRGQRRPVITGLA